MAIRAGRLVVLVAAAERGSFAAAAQDLFLTPSAVSQQVASLEREVGAMLFERSSRGVELTEPGRVLVRYAGAIVHHLADAQAEVDAITSGTAGRLALGSFPTATAAFVATAVAELQRRHERITVRVFDDEPYECVRRLNARELDLAVVFDLPSWPAYRTYDGSQVGRADDLELVHLCDDPFSVMLPQGHRLQDRGELSVEDLRHERVVGSSNDCAPWGRDLRRLCATAGFEPDFEPLYASADFQAQQAFVAAGLGISLLPSLTMGSERPDIVVLPLHGGPVRRVSAAFRRNAYRSPAAVEMVEVLLGLVAEDRDRAV